MPFVPSTTFDEVARACESFYQRDGFVSWSAVAEIFGVSRQAIQARVKSAVTNGTLDQATYDRWLSVSSRRALTRQREADKRAARKLNIDITLTPANLTWLRTEAALRKVTASDIINGLLNKARESA